TRANKGRGAAALHYPVAARQRSRLAPQFAQLQRAFEARRAELAVHPGGAQPEQVLVLEILGTVERFANAVRNVQGMEWVVEWDSEELPPDDDFYDEKHRDRSVQGRLFLIMS